MGSIPGSERSFGEGSGNPFQYSCLENPMDRGAWRATVSRLDRKSQMWLSNKTTNYRSPRVWILEGKKSGDPVLTHLSSRIFSQDTLNIMKSTPSGKQSCLFQFVSLQYLKVSQAQILCTFKKSNRGTSLVVQWLGLSVLPMQDPRFWYLVRELDPTCHN